MNVGRRLPIAAVALALTLTLASTLAQPAARAFDATPVPVASMPPTAPPPTRAPTAAPPTPFAPPTPTATPTPVPTYGVARVVTTRGGAEFRVAGKPFFLYAGAFFYERLPRATWDAEMTRIHDLGFDALDLYVPWNWHELADGDFDFDGRTNPRRDLREVLRLAKAHGFYLIVRPGPVIRNEWRNAGYPAWLLTRPDYQMPLRDVLEGRYPATATLQNAHSDDAARDWMRNATHRRYAERWLARALHEFDPVADRVLAVALDDDQGAYIDNQTWPAPHLRSYLEFLRGIVTSAVGPDVPTFINTYQMKVTASSPVWAMGNWYQSDAYALGEHDRSQLEFSTGLLETRPGQPIFTSEFQAGWLLQPQDVVPQPAAPSNTILALGTMLQSGVRGVVDFPPEDSLAPAGWEAPFSNAFYAWDAAIPYPGLHPPEPPRAAPTRHFGEIVAQYGRALAASHVVADAAIAWLPSAFDAASLTNPEIAQLADRTLETQRACRLAGLTCRFVDLRYDAPSDLARTKLLLLPRPSTGPLASRPFLAEIDARLRAVVAHGAAVASLVHVTTIDAAAIAHVARDAGVVPTIANGRDATFAASDDDPRHGFLTLVDYGDAPVTHTGLVVRTHAAGGTRAIVVPPIVVAAHDVAVVPLGFAPNAFPTPTPPHTLDAYTFTRTSQPTPEPAHVPLAPGVTIGSAELAALHLPEDHAVATTLDLYEDGEPVVVLQNDRLRVVVSPQAGGRGFVLQDLATEMNAFDTVGAMRDDVLLQPPLSTSDRIAKYTHQFPAGFFNRPFAATIERDGRDGGAAVVALRYDAPDAFPNGATFERRLVLAPRTNVLRTTDVVHFGAGTPPEQRGVQITSLVLGDPANARVLPGLTALAPPATAASPAAVATTVPSSATTATATATATATKSTPSPAASTIAGLYDATTHEAIVVATSGALRGAAVPAATPHTLVVTVTDDAAGAAGARGTTTLYRLGRVTSPSDLASLYRDLESRLHDRPGR